MSAPRQSPTREHDLRMHLGVVLMGLQMLTRPPTTPLQADQQELIDIITRATKAMQVLLDTPPAQPNRKVKPGRRGSKKKTPSTN